VRRVCGRLAWAALLLLPSLVSAADRVVLQLQWEHEFQYAGYYAAKWQGFYERAGLEVEIRPGFTEDGRFLSASRALLEGEADFAIGGLDILLEQGRGADFKILAPVFQRSPNGLFALAATAGAPRLDTVNDLIGRRIAVVRGDLTSVAIESLLRRRGLDGDKVNYVDEPVAVQTLVGDRADVIVTYEPSALYGAQELGVRLNDLDPERFGLQSYGDTLYTLATTVSRRPDLVRRFVDASLEGWRYALANRVEIADRISAELPRHRYRYDDPRSYNRLFADLIDKYVQYPAVELGHIDRHRFQQMYSSLAMSDRIEQDFNLEDLFVDLDAAAGWRYAGLLPSLLAGLLALLAGVLWWQRLPIPSMLAAAAAMVVLEFIAEGVLRDQHQESVRQRLLERLADVSGSLQSQLSFNLSLLNGLASFVAANPDMSQAEFENYARAVLRREAMLVNLAAAPDMVIRYVHPRVGNEAALGLDYRRSAEQWPAVRRVMESGRLVVAGPLDLVQGGRAFIGRAPVYLDEGTSRPWGLVSAPIRSDALYQAAGIPEFEARFDLAMRRADDLGDGEAFYGDDALFDAPRAVIVDVDVGGSRFQLAAAAREMDRLPAGTMLLQRVLAGLVALAVLLMMWWRHRNLRSRDAFNAALARSAEFLREVESVADVGGWRLDRQRRFVELSDNARRLLQLGPDSAASLNDLERLLPSEAVRTLHEYLETAFAGGGEFALEVPASRADGSWQGWLRIVADPVEKSGTTEELVGAMLDISEQKEAEQIIAFHAKYDALTELPNRGEFRERLSDAMATCRRQHNQLAVLFIDLDNFKSINDNLGHAGGDELLRQVADRLRGCVRDSDLLARQSGDEFAAMLQNVRGESGAYRVAEHILAELSKPFRIGASEVFCGASIGIAMYPGDAEDADTLLVNADQAMYEVKSSGRNGWHFYTREMQERSESRHRMFNDIRAALENGEFVVHYQPIVDVASGAVVACEALARWQRADGSWVSPGQFVEVAEETGLINRIDRFVASEALRFLAEECAGVGLSINVSPRVFSAKDQSLQRWLDIVVAGRRSTRVSVEITERLLIDETETAREALQRLSEQGLGISIDDFGTGYSSLSYLVRFPVTTIKIDRSFVWGIGESPAEETLVDTMLLMAQRLGLRVVAEGVETQAQLDYLRDKGCDLAQGFFIARPMSGDDFRRFCDGPGNAGR
jgi:diguanylate cyclase (GGDEF)-like protein/PAS domain S-box-containing protein